MSNIIENFKKSNPNSGRFRRFIPNSSILISIDKMIEDGKIAEAEATIVRFMPHPGVVTDLKKGNAKPVETPVETPVEKVAEPTPAVTEPEPVEESAETPVEEVTEPTPIVTEPEPVEEVTEPIEEVLEVVEETTPKKGRKKKTE